MSNTSSSTHTHINATASAVNLTLLETGAAAADITDAFTNRISGAQKTARQVVSGLCAVLLAVCVIGIIVFMRIHRRKRKLEERLAEELRLQQFEETPRTMTRFGFPPGGSNRNANGLQMQQIQLIDQLIHSPQANSARTRMLPRSPLNSNGLLAPGGLLAVMSSSTPVSARPVRSPGGTAAAPPLYNKDLQSGERILGRAGERACDTVKSPAQTEEEVQARYDREMQQLYEIRTARREESRARQDRVARRTRAKMAGDYDTLRELQQEALDAAALCEQSGSIALIREYENRDKSTKIASVNYHGLGIVRHDGSKVKAELSAGNPKYDFPGETWEAETFDDTSSLSRRNPGAAFPSTRAAVGSNPSSSSSSAPSSAPSVGHTHDAFGVCRNCPAVPRCVQEVPTPAGSALLPSYSAVSWGDAPPYSSPLFPRPEAALTRDGTAAQRASLSSTVGVKSPVAFAFGTFGAGGRASLLPTPTIAVTQVTPVGAPDEGFDAWARHHQQRQQQQQQQQQQQRATYSVHLTPTNVWAHPTHQAGPASHRTASPGTDGLLPSAQFEDVARDWMLAGGEAQAQAQVPVQVQVPAQACGQRDGRTGQASPSNGQQAHAL